MSELCSFCTPWGYCKRKADGVDAGIASQEAQTLAQEGNGNEAVLRARILHRREGADQYRRNTRDGLYKNCTQS